MKRIQKCWLTVCNRIQKNFWNATFQFIFILLFIQVFQKIFGPENSIVGIIFTIMMSASMMRDLTARPFKHLFLQGTMLMLMAAAACFVSNAPPLLALPVNLIILFVILYAYTYEYMNQLYFPYILSYLFLVFISPVKPEHMPKRLLAMFTGAICIILYQLVKGRKRVGETARDVLGGMCSQAGLCIDCLLSGKGIPKEPEALRKELCKLSKIIYERRKKRSASQTPVFL